MKIYNKANGGSVDVRDELATALLNTGAWVSSPPARPSNIGNGGGSAAPTTVDNLSGAGSAGKALVKAESQADIRSAAGLDKVDNTKDSQKSVASAAKLTTPRNINGIPFDGSSDITIDSLKRSDLADGSYSKEDITGYAYIPYLGPDGAIPETALDKALQVPSWAVEAQRSRRIAQSPVDILLIAGQSNAMAKYSDQIINPIPEDVVEWEGSAWKTPVVAAPWLGNSAAATFAELQARPANRRTGIVNVAAGGKGFSTDDVTWDRNKKGAQRNLANELISTAKAALAAAPPGSRIAALIWSQGEADGPSTYQTQFDDLISWVRTQLTLPKLPVLICSMTPEYASGLGNAPGVTAILEDTPRRIVNTAYVPGPPDLTAGTAANTGEIVHRHPLGHRAQGQLVVSVGYEEALLNRVDAAPLPPQRIRAQRSGGKATISWDHPPTRATSYTIETSTDEGKTWKAVTLVKPTTHQHELAVDAATPLWVRGRTTNETGVSVNSTEVKA